MLVVDQIIRAIQASIDELQSEIERLRRALAALAPGAEKPSGATATSKTEPGGAERAERGSRSPGAGRASPAPAATARARARTAPAGSPSPAARARTARGVTRAAILAALGGGRAMTAGEIAAATGLGRATISTTLTKLAGTGEIAKAERGYKLKPGDGAAAVDANAETLGPEAQAPKTAE
ncbi:MAG: winged helix-turn-helix domain-containing protein [Solirubrobacteraceae bacterium]